MNNIFNGKISRNDGSRRKQINTFFIDENVLRVREVAVCVNELKFVLLFYRVKTQMTEWCREQKNNFIHFFPSFFCRDAHTPTIDLSCGVHRVKARRGDGYSAMHGPRSYTTIEIELSVFFVLALSRLLLHFISMSMFAYIWCRLRPYVKCGNLNLFLIEFRSRFKRGCACHHRMFHYFGQVCQLFLLFVFCSGQFESTSQSSTIRPNFSWFIQMHSAIHF